MAGELRVDVYLPLYVRDFLAATLGWSAEERGHYLTLLMIQWDRGGIPAELEALERISPGVTGSWAVLEPKFPPGDDGLRRNRRLEEHREKAVELKQKRVDAARRAAASKYRTQGDTGSKATRAATGTCANRQRADALRIRDAEQSDAQRIRDGEQTHPPRMPDAEQTDAQRMRDGEQTQSNRRANGCHPPSPSPSTSPSSPVGEELQQQQPRARKISTSAFPRPEDGWVPQGMSEWEVLRRAWNATPGVERFEGLQFPRVDLLVARVSDPNWLRMYPEALRRLPSCRFFERPVHLRQFLAEHFVADVLCGTYDHPKISNRGQPPAPVPRMGTL